MLWLCIQLPTLPLEALTRTLKAGKQTGALGVVEQQWIVARNRPAAERGVAVGLSSATARARNRGLYLLQRDRAQEQQQLAQLARWSYRFTPLVSAQAAGPMQDGDSRPACLLVELSGSLKANGGLRALLDQVQQALEQMNLDGLMGLGQSPSAARLLSQLPAHRRWLAQAHSAPSPQQWQQWIGAAPSKLLDCDHRTMTQLYACGIRRVSQLRTMPLSEVASRFGRPFVEYFTRLNGSRQDPVSNHHLPAQYPTALYFRRPLEHSEPLRFPANHLLRTLYQQLQRRQCDPRQLHWQRDFGRGRSHSYTGADPRAPLASQRLLALTRRQREQAAPDPVRTLRLTCSQPEPLAQEKPAEALFNKGSQALLDKLKARLGHQALSTVALKGNGLPEQAWHPPLPSNRGQKCPPPPPCHPPRPNWLLPRPSPLSHRGHTLFYRGELQLLQGPEKIGGYWWQHGHHRRDYYMARGDDGGLYWVFQDLTSRAWFLHGIFS
ncbi:Y-family DNA polymerase [Microbulbifer sp. 2304DJ12-6]|uniref:Y-family DNA polymerase n=1 Tax=Microbulbifer sp. 2304DJ12-6 TaxID=3233340 RepID=UPI0039AE9F81